MHCSSFLNCQGNCCFPVCNLVLYRRGNVLLLLLFMMLAGAGEPLE